MAGNIAPNTVTDGLVLYLDAANPKSYVSGSTVWNDISTFGNNGTLTNGPTFNSANGGSIVFDGTNDVVVLGSTLLTGSGDFSLCSFVKRNAINTHDYICGNYGLGNNGVELYYFNDNRVAFYMVNIYLFSTTTITDLNWHHMCGIRTSGTTQIYIDGVLDRTGSANVSIPGNNPFTIGSGFDYNTEALIGNIANCQVYNRALSATEVLQNYNALKGRYGL